MQSLKHISAYLSLHCKNVSKEAAEAFLRYLHGDITSGKITRAKDKFHKEVDRIQRSLVGMVNVMEKGESCKIEIEPTRRKHYQNVLAGQGLGNIPVMLTGAIKSLTEYHVTKFFTNKGLSGVSEIPKNNVTLYTKKAGQKTYKVTDLRGNQLDKLVDAPLVKPEKALAFIEMAKNASKEKPDTFFRVVEFGTNKIWYDSEKGINGIKLISETKKLKKVLKSKGQKLPHGYSLEKRSTGKKKRIAKKVVKKEAHYPGKAITPNKSVKASVTAAINDLLTLQKYKSYGAMFLGMFYSTFKNDNVVSDNIGSMKEKMFEKYDFDLFEHDYHAKTIELTPEGKDLINSIQARLDTLKAKKGGSDLFPELAGISKQSIAEAHKQIDSYIKESQDKYDAAQEKRLAYIKKNGYPTGNDKEFDKLVKAKVEAEDRLIRLKKAKENLLPLEGTSQLRKGIKVEKEHAATFKKLAKKKISVKKAIVETAKTHIKEDKKYYDKMKKAGLNSSDNYIAIFDNIKNYLTKKYKKSHSKNKDKEAEILVKKINILSKEVSKKFKVTLFDARNIITEWLYNNYDSNIIDKISISGGIQRSAKKSSGLVGTKYDHLIGKTLWGEHSNYDIVSIEVISKSNIKITGKKGGLLKTESYSPKQIADLEKGKTVRDEKLITMLQGSSNLGAIENQQSHALPVMEQIQSATNYMFPQQQQSVQQVSSTEGTISGSEMGAMTFEKLKFNDYYKGIFGEPATNFDLCIDGAPGAGKTVFLLKFANYLAQYHGATLFVTTEEYGSSTLIDKVNRFDIKSPNLHFAKKMPSDADLVKYKFIFIDSINHARITIEQYQQIREKAPKTAFVLVLQQTKGGSYKGSTDWPHEVEMTMSLFKNEFDERMLKITKDRYTDPVPRVVKI